MTEPRNSEHRTKVHQERKYYRAANTKGGAGAAAGRTAYREEYQPDYGPDLDESLDGSEFAREL